MFERFTERARQVVVEAQAEARENKHGIIGTPHLLLGLMRAKEGLAARVLEEKDVTAEKVREQMLQLLPAGDEPIDGQVPFTPGAKKVMDLALREALSLGHNYVGTEHLLLGLVRKDDSGGLKILASVLDEDPHDATDIIRGSVVRWLRGPSGSKHIRDSSREASGQDAPEEDAPEGDEPDWNQFDYNDPQVRHAIHLHWLSRQAANAIGALADLVGEASGPYEAEHALSTIAGISTFVVARFRTEPEE